MTDPSAPPPAQRPKKGRSLGQNIALGAFLLLLIGGLANPQRPGPALWEKQPVRVVRARAWGRSGRGRSIRLWRRCRDGALGARGTSSSNDQAAAARDERWLGLHE